jgi:hypothetical protein
MTGGQHDRFANDPVDHPRHGFGDGEPEHFAMEGLRTERVLCLSAPPFGSPRGWDYGRNCLASLYVRCSASFLRSSRHSGRIYRPQAKTIGQGSLVQCVEPHQSDAEEHVERPNEADKHRAVKAALFTSLALTTGVTLPLIPRFVAFGVEKRHSLPLNGIFLTLCG